LNAFLFDPNHLKPVDKTIKTKRALRCYDFQR